MTRRAFTVEEANAALPAVRRTFRAIEERKTVVRERRDALGVLDALWGDRVRDSGNPDHAEYAGHRRALAEHLAEIERLIHEEIVGRGIRLPAGGLRHGLVDFPTTLDGRWVYLCWRSGEAAVAHWHEVDGGYRGRRPITPDERRRLGRNADPAPGGGPTPDV